MPEVTFPQIWATVIISIAKTTKTMKIDEEKFLKVFDQNFKEGMRQYGWFKNDN